MLYIENTYILRFDLCHLCISLSLLLKCLTFRPHFTVWASVLTLLLWVSQDPLGRKLGTSVQLMVIIVYKQVSNGVVKRMLTAKYHLRYTFHLLGKKHIALKVLPGFFKWNPEYFKLKPFLKDTDYILIF